MGLERNFNRERTIKGVGKPHSHQERLHPISFAPEQLIGILKDYGQEQCLFIVSFVEMYEKECIYSSELGPTLLENSFTLVEKTFTFAEQTTNCVSKQV